MPSLLSQRPRSRMLRPVRGVQNKNGLWQTLALVCVLLWANAATLAHEATHDASNEPEVCLSCPFGGALEDSISTSASLSFARPEGVADCTHNDFEVTLEPRHKAPARAPPSTS